MQDVVQLAGNQEEVVMFLTTPGSTVALHNGGTNTRLNVHIGLLNLGGSFIEVAGERREYARRSAAWMVFMGCIVSEDYPCRSGHQL